MERVATVGAGSRTLRWRRCATAEPSGWCPADGRGDRTGVCSHGRRSRSAGSCRWSRAGSLSRSASDIHWHCTASSWTASACPPGSTETRRCHRAGRADKAAAAQSTAFRRGPDRQSGPRHPFFGVLMLLRRLS
uniref:(northern house mosquito) hypothetical protein n=1 Tax=Culex pipiens TaxID=7175 RepID=A0A8D8CPL4_CULPI